MRAPCQGPARVFRCLALRAFASNARALVTETARARINFGATQRPFCILHARASLSAIARAHRGLMYAPLCNLVRTHSAHCCMSDSRGVTNHPHPLNSTSSLRGSVFWLSHPILGPPQSHVSKQSQNSTKIQVMFDAYPHHPTLRRIHCQYDL